MKKKVTFAAQDRIDDHPDVAREFFSAVLDMDRSDCLVTDESRLSDFASCGLPDEIADTTDTLQALYAAWDEWVVDEVARRYGLVVSPTDNLVDIFDRLAARPNPGGR